MMVLRGESLCSDGALSVISGFATQFDYYLYSLSPSPTPFTVLSTSWLEACLTPAYNVCMYVRMYVRTYVCLCMLRYAYVCLCVLMHAYVCLCMLMHAYVCLWVFRYVYGVFRYAYACLCVLMCAYVCLSCYGVVTLKGPITVRFKPAALKQIQESHIASSGCASLKRGTADCGLSQNATRWGKPRGMLRYLPTYGYLHI